MKTQYSSNDLVAGMSIVSMKNYCLRIARPGMGLSASFNKKRVTFKNQEHWKSQGINSY